MDIDVDLPLAWLFVREIEVQSRFALRAFADLETLRERVSAANPWTDAETYFREAWDANERGFLLAHAFLTHAANVSKILWPPPPRRGHSFTQNERLARAEALKRVLGVREPWVLEGRDFRDHLEHFDERLETWSRTEAGRGLDLVDMNQAPFGWSSLSAATDEAETLRTLTRQPLTFRFMGSDVNLEAVASELRRVLNAAAEWQRRVAGEGVKRSPGPGARTVPREMYLHLPRPDPPSLEDLDRRYVLLRELGIAPGSAGYDVTTLARAVVDRGWTWSHEQPADADGVHVARVTKPADAATGIETETAVARSWSVEAALALALATLLEEELRESRRPSLLRVTASDSWTLV